MKIIRSINQMQKIALGYKNKKTVAVVPTMGFLHEGHLSLVKQAKKKASVVVVTIFVNPTQFGPKEDFNTYPRDTKGDLAKLANLKVDYVFMPNMRKMYPLDHQTKVVVTNLTKPLCGQFREGHFDGVSLVVNKLFNITQPDFAVFGAKDYQQLMVIKQMVKDLNMPVKIISGKIVREKDGLAMSSRNAYLSQAERQKALLISKGLNIIKKTLAKKSLSVNKIKGLFLSVMPDDPVVRVEYFDVLNAKDLTLAKKYQKNKTLIATAVRVGKTRLIDNVVV